MNENIVIPLPSHENILRGILRNEESRTMSDPVVETSANQIFPCLDPAHPEMRTTMQRLLTFQGANWPQFGLSATPRDLAAAGFFYFGESDKVQCWYCGGGLENWDPQDRPWTEHAKWYPHCEFLLQQKGLQFVENVQSSLPRPQAAPSTNTNQLNYRINIEASSRPRNVIRSTNEPVSITIDPSTIGFDPEDIFRAATGITINRNFVQNTSQRQSPRPAAGSSSRPAASSSFRPAAGSSSRPAAGSSSRPAAGSSSRPAAGSSRPAAGSSSRPATGSSSRPAAGSSSRPAAGSSSRPAASSSSLPFRMWEVLRRFGRDRASEHLENQPREQPSFPIIGQENQSSNGQNLQPTSPGDVAREIQELQQSRLCKICRREETRVLFLPCAHVACCSACAEGRQVCPVCDGRITEQIPAYFS